jgi:hypothetical protein
MAQKSQCLLNINASSMWEVTMKAGKNIRILVNPFELRFLGTGKYLGTGIISREISIWRKR